MDRVQQFTRSIEHAMNEELPLEERNPDDVQVSAFDQTWSSTALGFNLQQGMAGQAFTTALTVVISGITRSAVYFGGQHAYTFLNGASQVDHVAQRVMPSQREAIHEFGEITVGGERISPLSLSQQDHRHRAREEAYLKEIMK